MASCIRSAGLARSTGTRAAMPAPTSHPSSDRAPRCGLPATPDTTRAATGGRSPSRATARGRAERRPCAAGSRPGSRPSGRGSVMLDMEMSALFYGVLTWIVTLPALTTSPMASAAPGVFWVDSRREPEPAHGPREVSLCGRAAERPACPDHRGTCHLVPGQAGHPRGLAVSGGRWRPEHCLVASGAMWNPASRAVLSAAEVCSGHLFGPVPDPAEHLLGHHKADHLHRLDNEPGPRPGVGISLTYEQP